MSFRADMKTIIIYDFEGHVSSIAFRRKDDFAFLATMLIILRLSYLSLFDNIVSRNEQSINSIDPSSKLQDIKFLFLNPIHIDVISVAEICIKEFDLTRSQSLGVLQAIIFLKIYRDHSPEIGIGTIGSNSQMNHRIIILVAYSLELNREADNHCEEMAEKKIKNLKRKIWHFLSTSDNSIIYGTEILTADSMYDTEIPLFDDDYSKLIDKSLDLQVAKIKYNTNTAKKMIPKLLLTKSKI